jgi:hypothetical protein
MPQPASVAGSRLARRLNRERHSSFRWTLWTVLLALVLGPIVAGMVLIVGALTIVGGAIAMAFPAGRRRVLGWWHGSMNPVHVEVSDDPVLIGATLKGLLIITRPVRLDALAISLRCVEEVTYRRGTNTHTERYTAFESVLAERGPSDSAGEIPFEASIPHDAMHTFDGGGNKLNWFIRVTRTFAKGGVEERDLLLDVYPAELHAAITQFRAQPRNHSRSPAGLASVVIAPTPVSRPRGGQ